MRQTVGCTLSSGSLILSSCSVRPRCIQSQTSSKSFKHSLQHVALKNEGGELETAHRLIKNKSDARALLVMGGYKFSDGS